MVNMSGNGKKVHDNNLLINQINHEEQQQQQSFSNQSSQRSSINNGSAKKRNSVLGLTKEYVVCVSSILFLFASFNLITL